MTAISTPRMNGPRLQFAHPIGPEDARTLLFEEMQDRFELTEEAGRYGTTEVSVSAGLFDRTTVDGQEPDDDLHWGRGTGIVLNVESIPALMALLSRYLADKAVQEAEASDDWAVAR